MRIRKEVHSLTSTEKQKLRYALEQVMAKPTNGLVYKDVAHYHGAPYTICPAPFGCCPHKRSGHRFLTWHRLYNGMSKMNLQIYCD